ncbi:MAG TPA: lipid-A-disaccharide synthase [Planctomycetaceae bacterium]|mgnify:CR=1 FL=1|nr:lipid-A-disaccharide synthase [Planctomycetaceae bacterium]
MKIFFSAGEPSGDQHTAHLIAHLRQIRPDVATEGFGGPAMQEQGCKLLFELTTMAVMGILRVLPMIRQFRQLVKKAEAHLDESPPDAVVLVDFPGFNWWIARAARRRGIPVYYYLPPQLWAWAPWRIRKVRRDIDHVICALPFEYEWYKARGVACTWVGHPFFDEVAAANLDENLVNRLRSESGKRTVALLPGSRNHEVTANFPVILEVVRNVAARVDNTRWVVGGFREEQVDVCRQLEEAADLSVPLEYLTAQTSEVIEAADCCLMVSGSISLELLARRTPGIVIYRISRKARVAAKLLMQCRFITLTNLIADEELMPEFVSAGDPKSDILAMADQLAEWCSDSPALSEAHQRMAQLADHAAETGATERAAELILELCDTAPKHIRHAA